MLRCAASFVIAAYGKSRPHSSGFARLASGLFTMPSNLTIKKLGVDYEKNRTKEKYAGRFYFN